MSDPRARLFRALALLFAAVLAAGCGDGRPPPAFARIEAAARGGDPARARRLLAEGLAAHAEWPVEHGRALGALEGSIRYWARIYARADGLLAKLLAGRRPDEALAAARERLASVADPDLAYALRRRLSDFDEFVAARRRAAETAAVAAAAGTARGVGTDSSAGPAPSSRPASVQAARARPQAAPEPEGPAGGAAQPVRPRPPAVPVPAARSQPAAAPAAPGRRAPAGAPRRPIEGDDPFAAARSAVAARDFAAAARRYAEIARDLEDAASAAAPEYRWLAELCRHAAGLRLRLEDRGAGLEPAAFAGAAAAAARDDGERAAAAWLLVRAGRRAQALALCRRAWRSAEFRPLLGYVVALARGEEPDPEGYSLEDGRFLSARERRLLAARKALVSGLDRALRLRDAAKRNRALERLLSTDVALLPLLTRELLARRRRLVRELARTRVRASLKRLRALRIELDRRRRAALELIFDEVRYFYPFRPPAVSPEKAKEYWKVQKEVDVRVAEVRKLWNGKGVEVTLPKALRRKLARIRWIDRFLAKLGREAPDDAYGLLLAAAKTSIRNVALDRKDRRRLERAAAIRAENAEKLARWLREGAINRGEADLVKLTNDYREMLGVTPLRADLRLMRSSHEHSAEMAALGYFSHTSPTPGRRTPFERMRRAGYPNGAAENIALNFSPAGALEAWQHSSGHHRNLLRASFVDLGCGQSGRHFTQNFGRGN